MGMKCRRHPSPAGAVGVCSFCLRERLEAVIADRDQLLDPRYSDSVDSPFADGDYGGSGGGEIPPTFLFPRSVSPPQRHQSHNLFFSTPQHNPSSANPGRKSRFSILSSLFGRHERSRPSESGKDQTTSSWFSSILPSRRKKSRLFPAASVISTGGGNLRPIRRRDCGMSPEPEEPTEYASDYIFQGRKSAVSAASVAAARRRALQPSHQTSLMFCLSPLIRPSPNLMHHKEQVGVDSSPFSGEFRVPNSGKIAVSNSGNSFCNPSRKFSDFGKYR